MAVYIWPPLSVSTLPPVGGATSANQALEIADLDAIKASATSIATNTGSLVVKDKIELSYAATNVTPSAYVQLSASTAAAAKKITLFESGGNPLILAIGGAGSEVPLIYIPPGGFNGEISIPIPAGSRVSVKSLRAGKTSSAGDLLINLLG